jgi:hypothetical protein
MIDQIFKYLPRWYFFPDYVEKKALSLGLEKLFLLTTRTADWYVLVSSDESFYVIKEEAFNPACFI